MLFTFFILYFYHSKRCTPFLDSNGTTSPTMKKKGPLAHFPHLLSPQIRGRPFSFFFLKFASIFLNATLVSIPSLKCCSFKHHLLTASFMGLESISLLSTSPPFTSLLHPHPRDGLTFTIWGPMNS